MYRNTTRYERAASTEIINQAQEAVKTDQNGLTISVH